MAVENEPILNAEVDTRSYFPHFNHPTWPEVVEVIDVAYPDDKLKIVKASRWPLLGLYRINSQDYNHYREKEIVLRNIRCPYGFAPSNNALKTGRTLSSPYTIHTLDLTRDYLANCLTSTSWELRAFGWFVRRPLNFTNRYFVAEFDPATVDLGITGAIGGSHFKQKCNNMQRYCYLSAAKHGAVCAAKEKFREMKAAREEKVAHKIHSDSSLRNINQLALAADVACTWGGGIGQIANALHEDPDNPTDVIIYAGANEIRHVEDDADRGSVWSVA